MAKEKERRIGEDQLVYGLPKRMSARAVGAKRKGEAAPLAGDPPYRQEPEEKGEKVFWTFHPKPGACEKCREMEGIQGEANAAASQLQVRDSQG